jgi:RNA 3'-terminal phosphate cyclase (ATP)
VLQRLLGWPREQFAVERVESDGPGNAVSIEVQREAVAEVVTAFGARGVPAEQVARRAVQEIRRYLERGAPVGSHLADQLLIPFALAGGGEFRAQEVTPHLETNAAVVERFLPVRIDVRREGGGAAVVEVRPT